MHTTARHQAAVTVTVRRRARAPLGAPARAGECAMQASRGSTTVLTRACPQSTWPSVQQAWPPEHTHGLATIGRRRAFEVLGRAARPRARRAGGTQRKTVERLVRKRLHLMRKASQTRHALGVGGSGARCLHKGACATSREGCAAARRGLQLRRTCASFVRSHGSGGRQHLRLATQPPSLRALEDADVEQLARQQLRAARGAPADCARAAGTQWSARP